MPGRLFATKLTQLIRALEAADEVANGDMIHDYVLANMHMLEPTALLAEIPREPDKVGDSALLTFNDAVDGIKAHDRARILRFSRVVKHISALTAGAETRLGFAEIRISGNNIVRVDDFLRKRALGSGLID